MTEYQLRVIDERSTLDGRLERLNTFLNSDIFRALSYEERKLLEEQAVVMAEYSVILGKRIELFGKRGEAV